MGKRLIDADKLTSCIRGWQKIIKENYGINDEYYKCLENVIDIYIYVAPTVDAELIRHGEWKAEHEHTYIGNSCKEWDNFYCPFCDVPSNAPYYYCPNCGAKMDGERKEE